MTVFLGAIATLVTAMGLIHAAIATGTASASPPIEKDPCCAVNHCTSSALPSDERPPITLADYARSARNSAGDPARGRALFADLKRVACVRCHRVRGQGGEVGPDLSDIGGKYDREQLIESVLEPSRQIVEGYRPVAVATTNGRVVTGIVREEVADKLLLVDIDGKRLSVRKQEVVERKTMDISLMPDGFFQGLSLKEFSDLIAYLASLRAAGQGTPGSGVVGPVALPRGFTRASVASGITGATAMDVAPDGRVLVCEQTGALRVVKDGAMLPRPFVRVVVDSEWERGLIGVALDPDFARNGFVYLCYIAASPYIHHRVSRFQARGDVAEPASERVLFEGDDQAKLGGHTPAGHQGGAIHFGADGKLYIAIGDQTAGCAFPAAGHVSGQAAPAQPGWLHSHRQPVFRRRQGQIPGDLGTRAAEPLHVCRSASYRPHLHQRRWRGPLGRDRRGVRGRELWLAISRGPVDESPLPRRSTRTRSPRSPAAPFALSASRSTSRQHTRAAISSPTSSKGGSRCSIPSIQSTSRPSQPASPGPSTSNLGPTAAFMSCYAMRGSRTGASAREQGRFRRSCTGRIEPASLPPGKLAGLYTPVAPEISSGDEGRATFTQALGVCEQTVGIGHAGGEVRQPVGQTQAGEAGPCHDTDRAPVASRPRPHEEARQIFTHDGSLPDANTAALDLHGAFAQKRRPGCIACGMTVDDHVAIAVLAHPPRLQKDRIGDDV